jgi:predicted secreted hydrolase
MSQAWCYTGNLLDPSGRRFGLQLSFFRLALIPPDAQAKLAGRVSAFAFNQVYFAITGSAAGEHVAFER